MTKAVYVTGCLGFIGYHLTKKCLDNDWYVYGIDKQTDDLLDELLSTIPNVQRTQEVLNNIHTMIQRFKQLRSEFSSFDEQNNANKPEMKGANYKPLVETLKKLNKKLYFGKNRC